jgi:SAM-dependent methyltransferase
LITECQCTSCDAIDTIRAVEHLLRATARAEARHFWFRGFRAFVAPLLAAATAGRTAPQILDCGCGTGANLELLDGYGRAFGFDLSGTGLAIGRQRGRTRTVRASVTAIPFPSSRFDVVTSFDVLYSLDDEDERRALEEMQRVLLPGGFAVINVAAMESLRGDHSVLSHEIRRYSRPMLRDRLSRAGFDVVRLTHTNISLLPVLLPARAFQRRRGLRAESDAQQEITVPPEPLNALLSGVVLTESVLVRWIDFPAGSSLLCLAQKPNREDGEER